MNTNRLQHITTALLTLLFCYTAISKLMDIEEFQRLRLGHQQPELETALFV